MAQAVVPGCSLSDDPGFCRAPNPQPSHEFVERASTTAIANEPGPPQDFGPRDVGILAQPLRDLRRVVRHRGRAARRLWRPPLPLRHLMEPFMTGLLSKSDTVICKRPISIKERSVHSLIRRWSLDRCRLKRTRTRTGNSSDPDAKITKIKDGRPHLAHQAEHVVDLD